MDNHLTAPARGVNYEKVVSLVIRLWLYGLFCQWSDFGGSG